MTKPLLLFVLMFAYHFVYAMNYRAVAYTKWFWIGVTDFAIAALTYVIFRQLAMSGSISEFIGYCIGGTAGALAGVWVSKHWRQE